MTARLVMQDVVPSQRDNNTHCSKPPTILVLPAPPSVNNLFETTKRGRRVRSKQYDAWIAEAGWKLRAQRVAKVAGEVVIVIGVERQSSLADVDNRIKPILDLLVKHNVIDDDRHVQAVAAAWTPPRAFQECRVVIVPAAPLTIHFQPSDDGRHGGWFLEPQPSEGA